MTLRRDPERPYVEQNRASLERKAQPPKDLLAWFLHEFREETPARIHARGVWHDRVSHDEKESGIVPGGGSLLGAPSENDGFWFYLYGDGTEIETARITDHGVMTDVRAYRMPVRAALRRLGGRGKDDAPSPFMSRTLYRIGLMAGDVQAACDSMRIEPVAIREVYVREALRRLWRVFDPEPPARSVRTSAVEAVA